MPQLFLKENESTIAGAYHLMSSQLQSLRPIHKDLPFTMLVLLIAEEMNDAPLMQSMREAFGSTSTPALAKDT